MDTTYSTNRKFRRMFENVLSIVVILAMAFPMTESVSAQEPGPWLVAFPESNTVQGWEWPEGATVYLTIDNAPEGFIQEGIAEVTSWGDPRTYVLFEFWEEYDLRVGDTITLTDQLGTTRTHTVQDLSVTEVNADVDTVSGTAYLGAAVQVWPHGVDYFIEDTAEDGTWFADFGALGFHTIEETGGRAQIVVEGNATAVDWSTPPPPPNPHLTVFPEWEFFDGLDWPDGATVSISVEGKSECSLERESWGGFFNGNFPEGCDVAIGDTVTFDDGTTNRTHIVRNLDVTQVEIRDDTIYGTADAGAVVHAWVHERGESEMVLTVEEDGTWMTEFWKTGFDLVEGMCGRSEIRDDVGNATAVDWCYPVPHFTAFPEWDYVEGWDWHPNDFVYLTIEQESPEPTTFYTQARTELPSWDPNRWWVMFDLKGQFDLKAGDTVQLDDDSVTRTMTVRNLSVTNVDTVANVVGGTADPGAVVQVWPHETGEQLQAEANAAGVWQVNFTGVFNLVQGACGRAQIVDTFDNATAVDWCAPKPWLIAFPENDAVEGWEWTDGATVTLTIDNAPQGFERSGIAEVTTWGDPRTYVRLEFSEEYDLNVGDVVTLTDGITTRTHVVQNLSITQIDADADTTVGTANADAVIQVWPHGYDQNATVQTTTDEHGTWLADFAGVFDLVIGTGGRSQVLDEFGNATAVDWEVPIRYDIYIFDTQTKETRQLTTSMDSYEYNPRWSPDSKKVVHDTWSSDWSSHGIYITDVTTGMSAPLAGAEGGSYPTWSPSGKWIAFDRGADNDYRLFIVAPTGGVPTLVREDAFMASWAPNSQRLAFHRPSDGAIWTTDLNGGNATKVTERGNGPAWSPDGEWIAFELNGDVWKVAVDSHGNSLGKPIQLTSGPAWEGRPTWSNNSKTIAFHAGMGQDTDIWMIPASGGTATWLTGAPVFGDYDPNYSFNGRYIAYSSFSPDGQAARQWIAAYTYDSPPGSWSEGQHTFRYDWDWNEPEPGTIIGGERELVVLSNAPSYDGYVLLRGLGMMRGVYTEDGLVCESVDAIRPDQPTRFLGGWLTDYAMTYDEALAHFESMTATAVWDEGESVELVRHEIFSWSSVDWAQYVCSFTE